MKQQTLNFNNDNDDNYNSEDFIVSLCNVEAYKFVTENISWPLGRLIIIGEEGSGKTHLTKIWQSTTNASSIRSFHDLQESSQQNDKFILDDFENLSSEGELFDIINHCQNNSYELLLTTNELQRTYKLSDLRSRLNATKKAIIKNPDFETLKILLCKHLSNRQLKVSADVVDYICSRSERSYLFIKNFVEELDNLSLEEKRNITIPFVKQLTKSNDEE